MNKADLEEAAYVDMSVESIRSMIDEMPDGVDELVTALDTAQGTVFSGQAEKAFVIITITK